MNDELKALLERAKDWKPTAAELFEQKVSWCYSMQKYPPALTKEQVRELLLNGSTAGVPETQNISTKGDK
jgi:hypothetical protein